MATKKITLRPGINLQRTPLLNEGGWSSMNLMRFREGIAEVLGGWVRFMTTQLQGLCRGLLAWSTLAGVACLAAGTHLRLYLIQLGTTYDITPILQTTTPTNPFTTTALSNSVLVSDPGLTVALTVGSFIEVSGGSAVGGLTLSGEYAVQSTPTTTSYTINAASAASSGATGGGTPTISYLLPAGLADQQASNGWGLDSWGAGTWGTPRSTATGSMLPRTWTMDHFGEQLIANARGAGVFVWLPSGGGSTRAAPITNAPTICNSIFVSNGAEQIIALGTTPAGGGTFNPMLVSWCDSGNYTVWTAAAGNAAGSYPLTDGSAIMWGGKAAQQGLIWTDTALYAMNYVGGVLIYGFVQLGSKCGLISPLAAAIIGNIAMWMSGFNFMWYNGTVSEMDCPIRDIVYKNINQAQLGKVVCSINAQFSEVRWDYPSANSTENDSYVIVNYAAQPMEWSYGNNSQGIVVARTAWIDFNVLGNPLAADSSGNLWFHESGYSAGGSALPWFIQSGEFDISDGQDIMFCDQIMPDQIVTNGTVAVWVYAQRFPNDPVVYSPDEPYPVMSNTQFIPARARGRQIALRFDNSFLSVGVFWRMGATRLRVAPDGRG